MKRRWKDWARKAGIRALKTVAQTAVATIGTTAVMNEVNWLMVGSASLLAGVPPCTACGKAEYLWYAASCRFSLGERAPEPPRLRTAAVIGKQKPKEEQK